jgi:hypothetical protein
MKLNLLAAVASVALMSSGVVAQAQENPKHDQQSTTERAQPTPRAGGEQRGNAMKSEAPRSAQSDRQQEPKGEAPKAAQTQNQRQEPSKAADTERKETPRAAQSQRNETPRAAERNQMQRQDEARPEGATPRRAETRDQNNMRTGAGENRTQHAQGQARFTGNAKMSNEHAERVGAELRRTAQPERVNVNVRVGERIPETVIIHPLPADIISLVPEYRGYDYFVDSDDEIVFVAPDTHEIVGTIAYEGRAAAEDATQVSGARPCPAND